MTGHHPSIKISAIFNFLINKNNEKNEQIQNNIEQILMSLNNKKDNEDNEENEEDKEGEDGIMGEDDMEEDEEGMEEEDEGIEEEDENEEKRKELISNNLIGNIKEPIKKPSFLNKKKKRENADKEIDIKENEDFDEHEDEDNNNYDNEEEEADEDSFIKEQYKSFNKLKKEKELLDKQKNEKEKKDIEMKNNFAIRKANKQVLEAKGITRKRKRYQGNAKLMNREKFYKKEKERKKLVKDYVGKPDVYTAKLLELEEI